ncbi:MAG: phosphoribosylanthranilate isomerase [Gemmataceae bacterium]
MNAKHIRVKICGLTTEADAARAAELGADAIGLNFHPPSPRAIDSIQAERILRALPPFVTPVGVFVERPLREVLAKAVTLTGLRAVQWYGNHAQPVEMAPLRYIPAFNVRSSDDLRTIDRYLEQCAQLGWQPSAILVDAPRAGTIYGGTGHAAPWQLLADYRPAVPLILAGGLTPDNVAEAIRLVRPYAVDVASGVEERPGKKDAEKLRRFIEAARGVG